VPVHRHGRVEKWGIKGRLDVLPRESASLCAGRGVGGHAAAEVNRDEARAVHAEEAGGEAGDGVIWEVGGKELEQRDGFTARGAQGAEILCPCRAADGEACGGERGGSGGGEKRGDVLDDLGGKEAEEGLVEGGWARWWLATDEGEEGADVVHCCGGEEMGEEKERRKRWMEG